MELTDPRIPALLATYDTDAYAWSAARAGDSIDVADGRGGLLVLRTGTAAHRVFLPLVVRGQ